MAAAALSATNQRTQNVAADPTLLTLDRLFDSSEFRKHGLGEYRWSQRTAAYFTFEVPQAGGKGRDLARRNDAATGLKEGVVPASAFVPEGQSEPLKVESFEFSADESKLLFYTNSKRVCRRNTPGDYWVLDLTSPTLQKLGGNPAPATLMFATFSPHGTRVAYARENDLYVQDLPEDERALIRSILPELGA